MSSPLGPGCDLAFDGGARGLVPGLASRDAKPDECPEDLAATMQAREAHARDLVLRRDAHRFPVRAADGCTAVLEARTARM
jgi:hypothetical protein